LWDQVERLGPGLLDLLLLDGSYVAHGFINRVLATDSELFQSLIAQYSSADSS